jgi:toxin ParE1/3/4
MAARGRVVPELAAVGVQRYRELIEGNYRIIYAVNENEVRVVAVLDGRRDVADLLHRRLFLRKG